MKLEEMFPRFSQLPWEEKVAFIAEYRKRREHDITSVQEFDLESQAKPRKTRSTKERDPNAEPKKRGRKPKEPSDSVKVTPEQLNLLRQLGMAV